MPGRVLFVIAYDIADNKRRAKIARLMESMGARVQGSVFEAYLDLKELEELMKKAGRIIEKKNDSLRFYRICEACRGKILTMGQGRVNQPPDVMVV